MKTRRLVANLIAFLLVSLALIAYGIVDLLGDPLESSATVSAVFPSASGIYDNFSVELDGVDVGSVSAVQLTRHGARVDMALDHGVHIPSDVVASIGIANDLGEQVVELTPSHGGGSPPLRSGAVIPVAPGGLPVSVGHVVALATNLLKAIPAGKLDLLLTELATALQDRAGDLRTIIAAGTTFSHEFLQYQQQFNALLANSPPVMNAVSAVGPQLRQALVNTESVMAVLANRASQFTSLLVQGAKATGLLAHFQNNQQADLACLFHDFSELSTNLSQPTNLGNLAQSLATNRYFFGAVNAVAVQGTAEALTSGQSNDPHQYFLRTRLLLPPVSPAGIAYTAQLGLPAVKPGAACDTEFGDGAPAASQAGFVPAANGTLSPPTAADAVVRGGADPSAPAVSPTSFTKKIGSPDLLPLGLIGAIIVPALLLAWGALPRRARRRRRA